MKKNRFTEFFKGKGYFVLLFVGVLAIAAVALIGSNLSSNDKNDEDQNYVDLNEPDNNIAAEDDDLSLADNNEASGDVANNAQAGNVNDVQAGQDVANNDSLLEYDVYTQEEENGIDLSEATVPTKAAEVADAEDKTEEPEAVATTGKSVKADKAASLNFSVDEGLLWPVAGNVIMNYSMDHTIYHATLMQFKCNPAIIIDAEVGTEVKAAADGIVTSIDNDSETGLTVTTDIGNGFSLVYGQLADDLTCKVGDKVKEGDAIATVDEPTKYYSVEGSNLYFMVMENNQTKNPMLYLR